MALFSLPLARHRFALGAPAALSAAAVAAFVACGGISDPTKSSPETSIGKVSGALTGGASLPSGAQVALVWRVGNANKWVVGQTVTPVAGKFSFDISAPPNEYFAKAPETFDKVLGPGPTGDQEAPSAISGGAPGAGGVSGAGGTSGMVPLGDVDGGTVGPIGPLPDSGVADSGVEPQAIHPLDDLGGTIGGADGTMESAIAGFVVFVDKNGNGQLDLDPTMLGSSKDEIIGGNAEFIVTYLRGGTSLDFEKLRDKAGQLPAAGINLGWLQGRWFPTDGVELKLGDNTRLPPLVCTRFDEPGLVCAPGDSIPCVCFDSDVEARGTQHCSADGKSITMCDCGTPSTPLIRPGDPRLHCQADGSWSYSGDPRCALDRLCDATFSGNSYFGGGCSSSYASSKPPVPVASDWPCPVPNP
jgi:hypothetical protein